MVFHTTTSWDWLYFLLSFLLFKHLPDTNSTSHCGSWDPLERMHAFSQRCFAIYTKHGWPLHVPDVFKPYQSRRLELTVQGDCLLWCMRVIFPKTLQEMVLRDLELHQGQPFISRMKSLARSYIWWPDLDKSVEDLASSCSACQAVKQASAAAPLHPWIWPTKPWHRIHVDIAGPLWGRHTCLWSMPILSGLRYRCTRCPVPPLLRLSLFWDICLSVWSTRAACEW